MKKRILSLVLCVCMLSSLALLFTSCGKKKVDFGKGYSVVFANDVSESMEAEVKSFTQTLKQKTGKEAKLEEVELNASLTAENDYEILIGNTNRPETQKALKKIKGQGYIVTAIGKKIVVVGTTNFLTSLALDAFAKSYLDSAQSVSSLDLEKIEVEEMEMLEFTNKWTFIHASYIDSERDCVGVEISGIKAILSSFSDVRGTAMPVRVDTETAKQEVLVGVVERPEAKAMLSGMDANNYGIGAKDGKLLISAHNDGMLAKALTLFKDALRDSVYEVEGEKKILLPADFLRIYADRESAVVTDFPRPEGLALSGSIDVHDGMEYYYEGDAVTAQAYNKYCEALVAAGYTVYTDNTAENSIFRTYVNTEKNITLYVAYNDFKYAAREETDHKKAIRIVASPLDCVNLLEPEMLEQDLTFDRWQNTTITAVKMSYASDGGGNIYVVTLEDGSFVLLDGGVEVPQDAKRIYEVLLDLYERGHGGPPTEKNPIRIAAWYVSHGHHDHFKSAELFTKQYCSKYDEHYITIDRLIANFPSNEELYNSEWDRTPGENNYNSSLRDGYAELSAMISDAPGEEPGFKYIKVHTGQRFFLANVEFEVMYTHEDQYPRRLHVYNDTSTVIRMHIVHTKGGGRVSSGSLTTMLWLGDAQEDSSRWMRAMWGDHLKSDMVQLAHHGGKGSEFLLYKLVQPEAAWYPAGLPKYNRMQYSTLKNANVGEGCTKMVLYSLPSLKYFIMSDVCNYTVSITEGGPVYATSGKDCVFNAGKDTNKVFISEIATTTSNGYLEKKEK